MGGSILSGLQQDPSQQQQGIPPAGQRPPITSYRDVLAIREQAQPVPPDLTPGELMGIGTTVVEKKMLPPPVAEPYAKLGTISGNLPDGDKSAWSRRSLRVIQGAMLAYGPDPNQWPEQVRQQVVGEAAEVQRLLRNQGNGRSR
jgi:hypothetical protein